MVRRGWLAVQHINDCLSDSAVVQRLQQVSFDQMCPAAKVDQACAMGQGFKQLGIENPYCLVIKERDHLFGVWNLTGAKGPETVKVTGSLSTNNGERVREISFALIGSV